MGRVFYVKRTSQKNQTQSKGAFDKKFLKSLQFRFYNIFQTMQATHCCNPHPRVSGDRSKNDTSAKNQVGNLGGFNNIGCTIGEQVMSNNGEKKIIGVAPGMSTGIAIFEGGKLRELKTIAPWDFRDFLSETEGIGLVVFEDLRLQSNNWGAKGMSVAAGRKRSRRDAGRVAGFCTIFEAELNRAGVRFVAVSPKSKGAKVACAKLFCIMFGVDVCTDQHVRDAALIASPYTRYYF